MKGIYFEINSFRLMQVYKIQTEGLAMNDMSLIWHTCSVCWLEEHAPLRKNMLDCWTDCHEQKLHFRHKSDAAMELHAALACSNWLPPLKGTPPRNLREFWSSIVAFPGFFQVDQNRLYRFLSRFQFHIENFRS